MMSIYIYAYQVLIYHKHMLLYELGWPVSNL